MNIVFNLIRYLLFIPICISAFLLINYGLENLLIWVSKLNTTGGIIIFILMALWGWGFCKRIAALIVNLASKITPNRKIGSYSIAILSGINCIFLIIKIWLHFENYPIKVIIACIIGSLLIFEITTAIIAGAFLPTNSLSDID